MKIYIFWPLVCDPEKHCKGSYIRALELHTAQAGPPPGLLLDVGFVILALVFSDYYNRSMVQQTTKSNASKIFGHNAMQFVDENRFHPQTA